MKKGNITLVEIGKVLAQHYGSTDEELDFIIIFHQTLPCTLNLFNSVQSMLGIIAQLGNRDILKLPKTAFLCSRKVPASVVLKCYDWAIAQREAGRCIISGFHSKIEKDVLHYLLKGDQPIIVALARCLKKRLEPELKDAMDKNRLLIVTPFDEKIKRVTSETANQRNRLMTELADEIFVAYALPGGNIEKLITDISHTGKTISSF